MRVPPYETMEPKIRLARFEQLICGLRARDFLLQLPQFVKVGGTHAFRGSDRRDPLEHRAQLDPVALLLLGELDNAGSLVARANDQSRALQPEQGLANGRLAHLQFRGKPQLAQRLPGAKCPE